MSFSEYLSKYLSNNNLSVAQASKIIGIDRSMLFRYTTGNRKPLNIETVEDIAVRLCMSAKEKREFLEEFDKQTLGDKVVSSFHYVNRLMETLSNADTFNSENLSDVPADLYLNDYSFTKNAIHITTPQAIIACALHIFESEKNSDSDVSLKLLMQPTYRKIEGMLTPVFGSSDKKIEQIICLEKTMEKCYTNLDSIEELLTPVFCLKNFNVYYHYDILQSHLSTASLLPNLILTDNCALLFDFEMQNGFFSQNKEFIKVLDKHFRDLKNKCSTFIEKGSYTHIVQEKSIVIPSSKIGTIFNQPCIVPCLGSKILNEIIVDFPLKAPLIDSLISIHGDWDGMEHLPPVSYATCCCSKNGILDIFRTGTIGEFPDKFYRPFTKDIKILILNRMIYFHKNKIHEYVILKNNVTLSNTVQLYWNPETPTVTLRHSSENDLSQINIAETSIYNSVKNYLNYVDKKKLCYTHEETLEFLKKVIDMVVKDEL